MPGWSMRTSALLAALAVLPACGSVCTGPGCENFYTVGRIELMSGSLTLPDESTVLVDATRNWTGDATEGSDWSITTSDGAIWIGQPTLSRVIRVPSDTGGALPETPQSWTGSGAFGETSALVDLDGNGVLDLVVGDPEYELTAGGVFVFLDAEDATGSMDETQADRLLVGDAPADGLGSRIAICGDMSGDTLPEIALGSATFGPGAAPLDTLEDLAGVVFVIDSALWAAESSNRAGVDPSDVGQTYWGEAAGDGAGSSVVCDRDVSGDRIPDLIVGAPWHKSADAGPNTQDRAGRVYVVQPTSDSGTRELPASGQLLSQSSFALDPPATDEWFGASLVTLDIDQEEPSDLIVGAPGYNLGAGRVHIYSGRELQNGVGKTILVINNTDGNAHHFGRTVATGDFDGDERDDIVVGAPDWQVGNNGYDAGRVWMWSGATSTSVGASLTLSSARWQVLGSEPFQRVGRLPTVVDLDGDGIDDLLLPTASLPE